MFPAAMRPRFGVDLIHEPVMSGALSGTAENLTVFPLDPTNYLERSATILGGSDLRRRPPLRGPPASDTPAANGSFSQNLQRLGFYAEDSWRCNPASDVELRIAVRHDGWTVHCLRPLAVAKPCLADDRGFAASPQQRRAP